MSYIIVRLQVSVLRVGAVCEGRVFVREIFFSFYQSLACACAHKFFLPSSPLQSVFASDVTANLERSDRRRRHLIKEEVFRRPFTALPSTSLSSPPSSSQQGVATDCSPCTAVGKSAVRILRKTFLRVRCFIDRCLPGRKRCGPRTCSMLNRRVTALAVSSSTWHLTFGMRAPLSLRPL